MASSIKPFKEALLYSVDKVFQATTVVSDTVVMEITNKHLIHPFDQFWYFVTKDKQPVFDLFVHFLDFLVEFLPAGFPFHSEPSVPTLGTVVCESEKGKSLRLRTLTASAVFLCKLAEFDQPALLLLQTATFVPGTAMLEANIWLSYRLSEITLLFQRNPDITERILRLLLKYDYNVRSM